MGWIYQGGKFVDPQNKKQQDYLLSESDPNWEELKGNYLTIAQAAANYQPKGTYLTLHLSLANYMTLTTDQVISGNKTFANALKIQGDGRILSTLDSGAIRLFGGTSLQKGASFIFHGKDYTDDYWKGAFNIIAHDGTTYKELIGKPDGTLTWNGKSLITADSLDNYVTLTTDLTISGSKTFLKDIILKSSTGTSQGAIRANSSDELILSDNKAIYFRNTNTQIATTENGLKLEFLLSGTDYNTLRPETNEGLNLGRTGYQWDNIYGKIIYLNGKQVANKEDIKVTDVKVDNASVVVNGVANITSYDDSEVRELIEQKQYTITIEN